MVLSRYVAFVWALLLVPVAAWAQGGSSSGLSTQTPGTVFVGGGFGGGFTSTDGLTEGCQEIEGLSREVGFAGSCSFDDSDVKGGVFGGVFVTPWLAVLGGYEPTLGETTLNTSAGLGALDLQTDALFDPSAGFVGAGGWIPLGNRVGLQPWVAHWRDAALR